MRRFDAEKVTCPFDKNHVMPSMRLQYHLSKCKTQFLTKNPGAKVFHCKHHFNHVFLDEDALIKHQTDECQNRPELVQARANQREKQYAAEREKYWAEQDEEEKQSLKRSYQTRSEIEEKCNSTLEITLEHVTLQQLIESRECECDLIGGKGCDNILKSCKNSS